MINLNKTHLIQLTGIYFVLAVAGLCSYNFKALWGPITKRGFECEDDSLKKPYLEDTISSTNLYIISVYIPIAIVILCEFINNYIERKNNNESQAWFNKFFCKVLVTLTPFLFGLVVERLLKNVAKYKMGRLRPHFLDVCQPIDMNGSKCQKIRIITFMEKYECSSTYFSSDIINAVFLSFPSGHSSLSFYGMVFLVCYLQRFYQHHRLMNKPLAIFLPIIQISCIFLAYCVAISRVWDYKHHWSDVFGGSAWGSGVALAVSFYMNFRRENIEALAEKAVSPESAAPKSSSKYLAVTKASEKDICSVELTND